jgi:hypothetical protein
MPGTTITTLTADQFAQRIAKAFPNGWASAGAKQPGGNLYALLKTAGSGLSFEESAVAYALNSMRIQTATAPELDLAAQDFLGTFPRAAGEPDTSYRARILAAILAPGATRIAIQNAVKAVTGVAPRMMEPWSTRDSGVFDGGAGAGMMFYDVDTIVTPGRLADPGLAYQGFLETILPVVSAFAGNAPPTFDTAAASGMYFDIAGSSMLDPAGAGVLGQAPINAAINAAKVFGTIVWVKIVPKVI